MKKKRWIILIIIVIIIWAWATYFLCIKESWEFKTESVYQDFTDESHKQAKSPESECQEFIDECCKQVKSFYAWMIIYYTSKWRTNMDDECDAECPKDCTRYTEERWYFKDKKKQQEFYANEVEECKKKYKECKMRSTSFFSEPCYECDEYWQPRYYWD
jgi:hypothetical protein